MVTSASCGEIFFDTGDGWERIDNLSAEDVLSAVDSDEGLTLPESVTCELTLDVTEGFLDYINELFVGKDIAYYEHPVWARGSIIDKRHRLALVHVLFWSDVLWNRC